jgi:hypothetical protein
MDRNFLSIQMMKYRTIGQCLLLSLVVWGTLSACVAANTPTSTSEPLCDNYWIVTAKAWIDTNENGVWDAKERPLQKVKFWAEEIPSTHGTAPLYEAESDFNGEGRLDLFLAGCPKVKVVIHADVPLNHRLVAQDDPVAVTTGELVKSIFQFGFVPTSATPTPSP